MSLSMLGQIDEVFESVDATLSFVSGRYVDGIWQEDPEVTLPFTVNIQPASDREIDFVLHAGERIVDVRRIYVNDGDLESITLDGSWTFLGQRWKIVRLDNRYWRDYCKCIVTRIDGQPDSPK